MKKSSLSSTVDSKYQQTQVSPQKLSITEITSKLQLLIKQADSSGKSAWHAGELLNKVKAEYSSTFSFENYVLQNFNISLPTANAYIKIYDSYSIEEIGNLLVTSLTEIAAIKNTNIMKAVVNAFANLNNKDYKLKEVLMAVALLEHEEHPYTEENIQDFVKKQIEISKAEKDSEKLKRKNYKRRDTYGAPLKSEFIPELGFIFERQPINEMGVVALFCVIFNWMRQVPFVIEQKKIHYFHQIKYVQTGFPDACIICRVEHSIEKYQDLHIEFEYKSFEYLIHKHHHCSTKSCEMIICWEDNARSNPSRSKSENVKKMPHVLELKDYLVTGKINLK